MNWILSLFKYSLDVTLYAVGSSLFYFLMRQFIIDVFNVWTSRKIEEAKGSVSKKVYVSKIKFDTEFQIYRELNLAFYNVKESISILIPCSNTLDERQFSDAQQLKAEIQRKYRCAARSVIEAHRILGRNMAFIQAPICEAYEKILKTSEEQLFVFRQTMKQLVDKTKASCYNTWPTFKTEEYYSTKEISDNLKNVNIQIREYLSTFDILR